MKAVALARLALGPSGSSLIEASSIFPGIAVILTISSLYDVIRS